MNYADPVRLHPAGFSTSNILFSGGQEVRRVKTNTMYLDDQRTIVTVFTGRAS